MARVDKTREAQAAELEQLASEAEGRHDGKWGEAEQNGGGYRP